jgi:fructose-bisphosphate aldolase class 1
MILPGLACRLQPTAEVVAETTITSLLRVVPAAVRALPSSRVVNPGNLPPPASTP